MWEIQTDFCICKIGSLSQWWHCTCLYWHCWHSEAQVVMLLHAHLNLHVCLGGKGCDGCQTSGITVLWEPQVEPSRKKHCRGTQADPRATSARQILVAVEWRTWMSGGKTVGWIAHCSLPWAWLQTQGLGVAVHFSTEWSRVAARVTWCIFLPGPVSDTIDKRRRVHVAVDSLGEGLMAIEMVHQQSSMKGWKWQVASSSLLEKLQCLPAGVREHLVKLRGCHCSSNAPTQWSKA